MKKVIHNNLLMLRYISKCCPGYISLMILSAVLSSLLSAANVLILKYIINALTEKSSFISVILPLLCFLPISFIFSLFFSWLNEKATPKNAQLLRQKMQTEVFEKACQMDLSCYENGDFYNKFTLALEQADTRAIAVLNTFSYLIGTIASITTLSTLVTALEPTILLFVAVNVGISVFLNTRTAKIRHKFYEEQIPPKRAADYTRRVFYLKNYAKELRIFADFPSLMKSSFEKATGQILSVISHFGKVLTGYRSGQNIFTVFMNTLTSIYLAFRAFKKFIQVADFVVLSNCSQQLTWQITTLIDIFPQIYEHSIYIENFTEFLKYEPQIKSRLDLPCPEKADMEFKNVSFSYPDTDKTVLKNINIQIKHGEKVAFVGKNGAGKTTLIKLITRLYDPTAGEITLNSTPYQDYSISSLRGNVGVVFQDFQAFAVTIAENILMRPIQNRQEDEKTVKEALRFVGLLDKVLALPDGIYTVLTREFNDNGTEFSGGEMQKLAVARIYAQSCNTVILDEPSSALDAYSEKEIFDSVFSFAADKTVILISHRLANVIKADKIFFIEDGCITEHGTHDELIKNNGNYCKMFNTQAAGYREMPRSQ